MADIFLRGGAPLPPGGSGAYSGGYSRRPNGTAYVGVGGGSSSPYLATGGGKGRPDTILNYVKVTLEGEAGALTRAEFQATAYTPAAFEGIISGVAQIGNEIEVSIDGSGGGGSWSVTVYKHAFNSSKEGKWTVTATGVGKGLELLKKDATAKPPAAIGKLFYKNGVWKQEETPAGGLVGYLQHEAMRGSNKIPILNSLDHGKGKPGKYFQLIAPSNLVQPAQGGSAGPGPGQGTLTYFTLQYIVDLINTGLGDKKIGIKAETTMTVPGGLDLISGDPVNVLIPNGTKSDYGPVTGGLIAEIILSLLGIPNSIGTSFADVTNMTGDKADCGLIMISYIALRGIDASMAQAAKDAASSEAAAKHSPGSNFDVEGFFASVFNLIHEATGGHVDLCFMMDPKNFDSGGGDDNPIIVNRRGKQDNAPGIAKYDDVSGNGGVRQASFKGDVPQGWQAEAFANASAANSDGKKNSKKPKETTLDEYKEELAKKSYDSAAASGLKSAYRNAMRDAGATELATKQTKAYPIGLSLQVNGVSGIGFGHAIEMTSLSGTRWGKVPVAFTVTRVVHTVQNQDWTTDISTVARILPG